MGRSDCTGGECDSHPMSKRSQKCHCTDVVCNVLQNLPKKYVHVRVHVAPRITESNYWIEIKRITLILYSYSYNPNQAVMKSVKSPRRYIFKSHTVWAIPAPGQIDRGGILLDFVWAEVGIWQEVAGQWLKQNCWRQGTWRTLAKVPE
jgi:hypothetical protein